MTSKPMISVIIPTFNCAGLLATAIRCCQNQTYASKQIIVIDDGSTDGTVEIVRQFPEVLYIKKTNGGVASARNRGLDIVKGRYVAFLDADDEIAPQYFELAVKALEEQPIDFVIPQHFCEKILQPDGSFKHIDKLRDPYPVSKDEMTHLLLRQFVGSTAMIAKTECFNSLRFDTSLKYAEDLDLWLRLVEQGFRPGLIPSSEALYFYRIHPGSITTSQSSKAVRSRWKCLYQVLSRRESAAVKKSPNSRELFADKYWRIGKTLISSRQSMLFGVQLLLKSQLLCPSWSRLTQLGRVQKPDVQSTKSIPAQSGE